MILNSYFSSGSTVAQCEFEFVEIMLKLSLQSFHFTNGARKATKGL